MIGYEALPCVNLILSKPHNTYAQAMAPMDRHFWSISGSKAKELSNSQLGVPECRQLNTAAPPISIRPVSESYPQGMRNS